MQQMLSREEQKTLLSIEPPLVKTQYTKALDRFGYKNNTTDEEFNVADLHNKRFKQDRCIIGFENILPRKFRNSIYQANEGIQESAVVDKNKVFDGWLSTVLHDPKPLQFNY